MDKNELDEALNELSRQVIAMGQHIGTQRHAFDLEILGESLLRSHDELMRLIRIRKLQGQ